MIMKPWNNSYDFLGGNRETEKKKHSFTKNITLNIWIEHHWKKVVQGKHQLSDGISGDGHLFADLNWDLKVDDISLAKKSGNLPY